MGILLRIVNQSSIENSEFVIVSVQKFIQEQYVVVTISLVISRKLKEIIIY